MHRGIVPVRCDPDASNHVEGDGEEVYGTKGSVHEKIHAFTSHSNL